MFNKQQQSPLSQYTFHILLGSGITGKVFLAIDSHGNKVAIKSMVRRHIPAISLQETEIMKAYPPHPNVVALLDRIDEPDTLHLVLNYIGKDNLMTYVNRDGAFSELDARKVFEGMILGLQHLHTFGIVHRDIKCENILLTTDLKPVICDLGFGARWKKGGRLHDFCGSFHYASPEILSKRPYEGPEIDIWSMGVVLFAIIARQLPWDGSREEMIQCISTGDYWVLEFFSEPLRELLDNILQPIVHLRWTIPQIKESRWFTGDAATLESGKSIPISISIASSVGGQDVPSIWTASGRYSGRSLFSSKRSNGPERIEKSGRFTFRKMEVVPEGDRSEPAEKESKEVEEVPQLDPATETESLSSLSDPIVEHVFNEEPKGDKDEEKLCLEQEAGDVLTGLEQMLSKLEDKNGKSLETSFETYSQGLRTAGTRQSVDLGEVSWTQTKLLDHVDDPKQKHDSPTKKPKNPIMSLYARLKFGKNSPLAPARENSAPQSEPRSNSNSPNTRAVFPAHRAPVQRYETS